MKPRYIGASILSLAGLISVVLLLPVPTITPPVERDSIQQPPIQVPEILEPDLILDAPPLLSEINLSPEPIQATQEPAPGPRAIQTTPNTPKLTQAIQKPQKPAPVCQLRHRRRCRW